MHRHAYIRKPFNSGTWLSAPENWTLTDTEILKAAACVHPHSYLGARFGKFTRFALFDIDAGSKHHSKAELRRLVAAIADAGLMPPSIYRSSESGGYHLYLFFDEPISSVELRRELYKLLSLHGFKIGKGQLEIFPNVSGDSLGFGCRLPLQEGFAWINRYTLDIDEERSHLSPVEAVGRFLTDAKDSNSYDDFRAFKAKVKDLEERKAAVVSRVQTAPDTNVIPFRKSEQPAAAGEHLRYVRAVFRRLPPGIIVDNWYRGRLYHLNGLTGPSQRADAIECVGHYLFYGDPSRDLPALGYGYEQEREWAITEFLKAQHNGQSDEINRGRADAFAQIERAANWVPPHKEGSETVKYAPERPISWIRANANSKADARKRIAEALECLKKRGRSFTTVELQEGADCARDTLYKHQDLWRAEYERLLGYQDLADGFFASCPGEYNCVEGGGSLQTSPPSTSLDPDVPAGRLAARRIAYEISMRSERQRKQHEKAAAQSMDASEKDWLDNVTAVTESDPSELTIPQLKALLTVLAAYLAVAPSYECQQFVQERIGLIRKQLAVASEQALFIVRPP
ncbi:MAG TPA: hypothetical protein V6C97_26735 [Oculatellaceae cyanobacterium]|jgi:hypothetical protein